MRVRFVGWALALFICGCGGQEGTSGALVTGKTGRPIVGGQVDPGDPAVVGLADSTGVFCSGTLIDSLHVLTAGHCVDTKPPYVFICPDARGMTHTSHPECYLSV